VRGVAAPAPIGAAALAAYPPGMLRTLGIPRAARNAQRCPHYSL
jgi:hypothetical protein